MSAIFVYTEFLKIYISKESVHSVENQVIDSFTKTNHFRMVSRGKKQESKTRKLHSEPLTVVLKHLEGPIP